MWNFPCSAHTLSRAPLYFQLVGFLKQIVRCDAGKFEKDTERGGDLMQWTQVRRYEWCKNGIFTTWLEREEGIWQGWILIGFTQCAPMHCFLYNGAHSGNSSSVFCYIITVIDSSCLQCPWSNSNMFFFKLDSSCLSHLELYIHGHVLSVSRILDNTPHLLALFLIWWLKKEWMWAGWKKKDW